MNAYDAALALESFFLGALEQTPPGYGTELDDEDYEYEPPPTQKQRMNCGYIDTSKKKESEMAVNMRCFCGDRSLSEYWANKIMEGFDE